MEERIIESVPIREQVTTILRKKIINGELEPEQQLSERTISQMLQVSTSPVKEAFRTLQSEGLIYTVPRKGSFVSKFSKKNLLEFVFMRGSLEGVAAYFACINAEEEEIAQMEEALEYSGKLVERSPLSPEEISELINSNNKFHSLLRNASQNSYLVGLIMNLRSIDQTLRDTSLSKTIEEPVRAHKEHMAIMKAVKARNAEEAEQLMISHTRRVGRFVLSNEE